MIIYVFYYVILCVVEIVMFNDNFLKKFMCSGHGSNYITKQI